MTNVIKSAPEFSITYRREWRGRESLQRVHELRRFGERRHDVTNCNTGGTSHPA